MVMGVDSCSKGQDFESCHRILVGQFFHSYLLCLFDKMETIEKEVEKRKNHHFEIKAQKNFETYLQ